MNPTEIIGQVRAEEHQLKLAKHLIFALREAKRLAFNTRYNHAQLNKEELQTLLRDAHEVVAIIKNEIAKGGKIIIK